MPVTNKRKFYKTAKGETIELFYIGLLADMMGRSAQTIRKWEISGVIPSSGFKDGFGRRLYTMSQISAIMECAEKSKMKAGLSIWRTAFPKNVKNKFEEIHNDIFGADKSDTTKTT